MQITWYQQLYSLSVWPWVEKRILILEMRFFRDVIEKRYL
jgi:hypothetical protein